MNGAEDVDSQKDAYPPKLCHLQLCVFRQPVVLFLMSLEAFISQIELDSSNKR